MVQDMDTINLYLKEYFDQMGKLKEDLPQTTVIIDKVIALQEIKEATPMRAAAADIVLELGEASLAYPEPLIALGIASVIQLTANLLAVKIQIAEIEAVADAEDELFRKPHILH